MNPQVVKRHRKNVPMVSSTMQALSGARCTWCQALHITNKDTRDVRNELLLFHLETSNFNLTQKCSRVWLQLLEMQSFSRCKHFLKASQNADLGTVIRYRWKADASACEDWYFGPTRNYFNFVNIKKSHGARSREYGRWGKTPTFSFFKNTVTISEAWAGLCHVEHGYV